MEGYSRYHVVSDRIFASCAKFKVELRHPNLSFAAVLHFLAKKIGPSSSCDSLSGGSAHGAPSGSPGRRIGWRPTRSESRPGELVFRQRTLRVLDAQACAA